MLEDNIGYIWIYEFEGKTLSQFEDAYNKLKEDGMNGLIVDLRDNPGGDLDVVINLCDMFLDDGLILYTKDKNGKNQEFMAHLVLTLGDLKYVTQNFIIRVI